MGNAYEYVLPYKAEEIKNILDKFQNSPDVSGSGHSPRIGDNGNWFEWDADSNQYVDTGVQANGKDGKSGLLNVLVWDGNGYDSALPAYTELRFVNPVDWLSITEFEYNEANPNVDMWAVTFTAGEYIAVALPTSVEWAVAEPTFTAGYTYYLSFIPFGDKILGVWVAKELTTDEQTVV